ncbi:hypothetical protein Q5Y75_26615 [Ruegeria sp. 2205SS24-7]|uniref:hypothetical protein n=1 Tax=Ruegeria discodermiae TaxID=3064389 RepID=UPI0027408594|nr:hypothetical protein [Ruegeria sp. 2205SS24-7]MDP5220766.1 hypothetical protein [Ruegeria sp. 2205SS24-7]
MTGQSENLRQLLEQRLQIVARISAAQAEYLKLQQSIGGLSFAHMSLDPEEQEQAARKSRDALETREAIITKIEEELRVIDDAIACTQSRED